MDAIFDSLATLANFYTVGIVIVGVIAGIVIGSIPGFTITMGVALTLPFSFGMEPINGVALMVAVMVGGSSGGLLPAILLGIPGTPSAMATTFDGYPMAKRGEAGRALSVGLVASVVGSLVSGIILVAVAPVLATFASNFGPWEMFSLMLFGLTAIASIGDGSVLKGLIAGFLGVAFSLFGIDLLTGASRFTFGFVELSGGFNFLPVLIGLFAFSQLLTDITKPVTGVSSGRKDVAYPLRKGIADVLRKPLHVLRSSLVGTFVGILPGAGGSIANVMSYDIAKKTSRTPEKYGTGVPEGVIASEAANNSSVGGALVPAMAFGIPGDATTAMMLGALIIHGVQPGPLFLTNQPTLAYGIFIVFFFAALILLIIQAFGIRLFLLVNRIPQHHLVPGILVLCTVGSFAVGNRIFDVGVLLLFGLIGYWMKLNEFPLSAFILGIILGPMLETNLRQALATDADLGLFISRPISGVLVIAAVASLVYGLIVANRTRRKKLTETVVDDVVTEH